ncbi:MAG: YgiT-type zinc finger protein [Candidatus Rokubacteria bacterium]|nr:YgiT-type zinc finger protein [Candidatus Rokubacteria bacterium]MBI4437950.1 YgiT-type zinc finger protein [Candidatus Uhrbacteria bacterium]
MRCEVCGAELKVTKTDLPFKVRDAGIVILKSLPVFQCASCPQYLIEDAVPASTRSWSAWTGESNWRSSCTPPEPMATDRRTARCSRPGLASFAPAGDRGR